MQIEKTVFISYRRTNVFNALAIYQNLTAHGFDVFFDYESIKSGSFEQIILNQIAARAHFVVLLTPSALERCNEPGDWLRREIEYALETKRNIVPLMFEGFSFKDVQQYLTGKLSVLSSYNAMTVPVEYFDAAMDKLQKKFLNVSLDVLLHPTPLADQSAVAHAQAAAAQQPLPSEAQLSAEEYVERGLRRDKKDFAGKIEDFTEAIRLNPQYAIAYNNRGDLYAKQGKKEAALADFNEAIRLEPTLVVAYNNRGCVRETIADMDGALADYHEALRLNPQYATAYMNRGNARTLLKDYQNALQDFDEAIRLDPEFAFAYYNRGLLFDQQGDLDQAIRDYTAAIRLSPKHLNAYYNRAVAYEEKNDFVRANADYQKYLDLGGKNVAEVRRWIAENESKLR
jgi:tetratricopeptide (TPR) repeat protein